MIFLKNFIKTDWTVTLQHFEVFLSSTIKVKSQMYLRTFMVDLCCSELPGNTIYGVFIGISAYVYAAAGHSQNALPDVVVGLLFASHEEQNH